MDFYSRKTTRLQNYNYNTPGYYFITICTKGKKKTLCEIAGTDVPGGPNVQFSADGEIVRKRLMEMVEFYDDIKLDQFVIMPNHVHLMLCIPGSDGNLPVSQFTNSRIGKFVGAFKRLTNREAQKSMWQSRSYDHVIRDEKDYLKIWNYIDTNPARWEKDCFYEV